MLTSADMSPTQEIDFHAEQLNLFLHILFIVSVHFGNILNSHLYFAFHFHIRCGSHVEPVCERSHSQWWIHSWILSNSSAQKRFSLFQRLFWPLSPQLHCIRSLSPYSWMYFQEQQGSKNPPYSQVVNVAKRPNISLASRNQNRTKVELVLVLHSSSRHTTSKWKG